MADEPAGRVAATLDEIRADIEETADVYNLDGAGKNSYPVSAFMCRHARSLLAAVEAALKLHARREIPVKTHSLCRDHSALAHHSGRMPREVIAICPECTVTEKYVCATCRHECPDDDEWPCVTYLAIRAALTGEEAGDGDTGSR